MVRQLRHTKTALFVVKIERHNLWRTSLVDNLPTFIMSLFPMLTLKVFNALAGDLQMSKCFVAMLGLVGLSSALPMPQDVPGLDAHQAALAAHAVHLSQV